MQPPELTPVTPNVAAAEVAATEANKPIPLEAGLLPESLTEAVNKDDWKTASALLEALDKKECVKYLKVLVDRGFIVKTKSVLEGIAAYSN